MLTACYLRWGPGVALEQGLIASNSEQMHLVKVEKKCFCPRVYSLKTQA